MNTFVVGVKSDYVGATTIKYTKNGEELVRDCSNEDYALLIGATTGDTVNDAIIKMAVNHDLPADILMGYQVS